jgi:hypothetical protein
MNVTSKENAFKIYRSKVSKGKLLPGLPSIPRFQRRDKSPEKKKPMEVSLIDFGIFSERKACEPFLRRLKATVEKEFPCGLDMDFDEDIWKFEGLLMEELKGKGRWLTEH